MNHGSLHSSCTGTAKPGRDALVTEPAREGGVDAKQQYAVRRPEIADSGRIRPGGGCRLPLQGAPMQRDRLPRVTASSAE
jgi:hypothetical protein